MLGNYYAEYDHLPTGPQYQPLDFTQEHAPQGVAVGYNEIIQVDHETLQKADRNRSASVVVYPCQMGLPDEPCGVWVEGDLKDVATHLRKYHGVVGHSGDTVICRWLGCFEQRKLCSMPRHVMTHLRVKFACSNCGRPFAREDCARAHCRAVEICADACIVNIPGPQARVVGLEYTAA